MTTRDYSTHDPLGGVDLGPCDDYAPDTLGDDPRVCTTCFYSVVDHAGASAPPVTRTRSFGVLATRDGEMLFHAFPISESEARWHAGRLLDQRNVVTLETYTEFGSDLTAPDDTPTQCPECGIGDSEYGLHESDCPSGGDGWDEAR